MRRRLLTRVFLRRFVENDLISPDADQMQVVSTSVGALFTAGLFVTVLMTTKYVMAPFMPPGAAAVIELDDQFLFCAWPMLAMAVVALVEWDALGLDARDSAILGPLPTPRATIVLAKLTAIALFAAIFLVALTLIPALLQPVAIIARVPGGFGTLFALMAAQMTSSLAAGLFGFSATLALRELLHAALGADRFHRVSRGAQMALLTACATLVLLMPLASSRVVLRIGHERFATSLMAPDWFVSLHEKIGGHLLDELPNPRLPPRIAAELRVSAEAYRAAEPAFTALSRRALFGLLLSCALAIGGFGWNARTLAPPSSDRRSMKAGWLTRSAGVIVVPGNATARAAFFFGGRTLARNVAHRMSMAAALASAIAGALIVIHASVVRGGPASPWLFAVQPFALAVLLAGFRHAVSLPADLRAAWAVSMAWRGGVRAYFGGVARAGMVWIVAPATLAFFPFYAWLTDWRSAAWLAVFGFLLGGVLLDALLLGQRTLPFVAEHVRSEHFSTRAPFYLVGVLTGAYAFGVLEQAALSAPHGALVLALTLVSLGVLLRIADARRRGSWAGLELEPESQAASFVE